MSDEPQTQLQTAMPGPELVTMKRGDALLLVPVRGGTARLSDACALSGSAKRLFERGAVGARTEDAAKWLEEEGAPPEDALRDAGDFLKALRERGIGVEPGEPGRPSPASSGGGGYPVQAEDLEVLAREVLASGHRLRFQARGKSMRPFLPHGSVLDVERGAFQGVQKGQVVLYTTAEHRLVAHRVIKRSDEHLVTRGDSSPRKDRVEPDHYLGTVESALQPGKRDPIAVSSGPRRTLGLVSGTLYSWSTAVARTLVIGPLRRSFEGPSVLRKILRGGLRVVAGLSIQTERLARTLRRPVDATRSALLSIEEKDEGRRDLYRERTVQDFTSLDENVAAGLTLIEEVLFARHPIQPCPTLVLGCGPGRECFSLAERGFDVTGLDREPGMLEQARRLAGARGLDVRFLEGEAHDFRLPGETFGFVAVFSGLYNMILPRERRLQLLKRSREHLRPGGRLALTFLSAYVPPGLPVRPKTKTFLEAFSPDHQDGDLFLLNESVHVFPRAKDLEEEALEAGFEVEVIYRDQRAYDRFERRVKGYAMLRRPEE